MSFDLDTYRSISGKLDTEDIPPTAQTIELENILRDDVVTQGRFTLNYKPKCRVGARQSFIIKEPGSYLLRVQTENTDSDHEHFSAIDILVEK